MSVKALKIFILLTSLIGVIFICLGPLLRILQPLDAREIAVIRTGQVCVCLLVLAMLASLRFPSPALAIFVIFVSLAPHAAVVVKNRLDRRDLKLEQRANEEKHLEEKRQAEGDITARAKNHQPFTTDEAMLFLRQLSQWDDIDDAKKLVAKTVHEKILDPNQKMPNGETLSAAFYDPVAELAKQIHAPVDPGSEAIYKTLRENK